MLSLDENATLLRSGFTQREINTQKQKFYNLFRVCPTLGFEMEQLRKAVELLEDKNG